MHSSAVLRVSEPPRLNGFLPRLCPLHTPQSKNIVRFSRLSIYNPLISHQIHSVVIRSFNPVVHHENPRRTKPHFRHYPRCRNNCTSRDGSRSFRISISSFACLKNLAAEMSSIRRSYLSRWSTKVYRSIKTIVLIFLLKMRSFWS